MRVVESITESKPRQNIVEKQILIKKTPGLIEELEELVESQCYPEALARLKEKGTEVLESLSHSPTHKKLLLLVAEINIWSHLAQEAGVYLDILIEEYPDIEYDFDYVILKIRIYLLQSDYDNCAAYICCCQNRNWSKDKLHWLTYFYGSSSFFRGDYFEANRLLDECLDYAEKNNIEFLEGCASYMLGYIAFQRCFFEIAEINLNPSIIMRYS